jgi:excisionase family DNA binding protein
MPETYYRTGAAAKTLGLSSYQIRRLAESGLIDAEFTGNQWRIPASEIDRLLKEGIPSDDEPEMAAAAGNGYRHRVSNDRDSDPHRAAGRVPEVVQAYAGAAKKHSMIEEREADWRLTELEDRFRAREHEMQTRDGKRESEVQHADWLRAVEKAALDFLDIKAPGAPPQMWLDLHKAIRERFAPLNPIPADQVTGELIRGTVQPFLDRHREHKEHVHRDGFTAYHR